MPGQPLTLESFARLSADEQEHRLQAGAAAYHRYGRVLGFRNFLGHRSPDWAELSQEQQIGWAAAAGTSAE